MQWEKDNGNIPADVSMLSLLSITCTHAGLQGIAKQYVEEKFASVPAASRPANLIIFLFSELETDELFEKDNTGATAVLEGCPHHLNGSADRKVKATFKFDIDQLFIQISSMKVSRKSMLDYFKTQ